MDIIKKEWKIKFELGNNVGAGQFEELRNGYYKHVENVS